MYFVAMLQLKQGIKITLFQNHDFKLVDTNNLPF